MQHCQRKGSPSQPTLVPSNPEKGTETQIRAAREVWKDAHYMFHLCQAVERALISLVVAAVESPYLAALWNTKTSRYGDTILKLLEHLSTTYGQTTPQKLKAKEMDICKMQFNMSHPVYIVFNAIDNHIEMSEYALMPISSSQAVNLAYVVFARNPILLLRDLRAWNRHSADFRTWDAMKIHLCEAQRDLLSLPVAGQMYNQELQQANLEKLPGSVLYNGLHDKYFTTTQQLLHNSCPTDMSSYCNEHCCAYSNGKQCTAACS